MRTAARWARWVFRVVATVEVLLALGQPVLAGGFLSGHYSMLSMHAANATATALTAVALTGAGVLLWRPGRGPLWPALASAALFGLLALQTYLGYRRVLAVHIPLGVCVIALLALLLAWSWRPVRTPDADTPAEPGEAADQTSTPSQAGDRVPEPADGLRR